MSVVRTRLALIALSALSLSACVVAPYPYRHPYATPVYSAPPPHDAVVVIDVAPPAPYVEVVPVIPYAGAVWIGGYWGWSGGRHVWTGGYWDHPRAGYRYQPHAWVQVGGRWQLHGGAWVRG